MKYSVNSLCFSYGETEILKNVSFEINSGEAVCILGPNGSGKTTLADCVLGFHSPQSGSVTADGRRARKTYLLSASDSYSPFPLYSQGNGADGQKRLQRRVRSAG